MWNSSPRRRRRRQRTKPQPRHDWECGEVLRKNIYKRATLFRPGRTSPVDRRIGGGGGEGEKSIQVIQPKSKGVSPQEANIRPRGSRCQVTGPRRHYYNTEGRKGNKKDSENVWGKKKKKRILHFFPGTQRLSVGNTFFFILVCEFLWLPLGHGRRSLGDSRIKGQNTLIGFL